MAKDELQESLDVVNEAYNALRAELELFAGDRVAQLAEEGHVPSVNLEIGLKMWFAFRALLTPDQHLEQTRKLTKQLKEYRAANP